MKGKRKRGTYGHRGGISAVGGLGGYIAGARSADDVALGRLELPAPGAPEPLSGYVAVGDCGCGCKGTGKCGGAMAGIDLANPTLLRVVEGAAAYMAYRSARKKKGAIKYALYGLAAYAAYDAYTG